MGTFQTVSRTNSDPPSWTVFDALTNTLLFDHYNETLPFGSTKVTDFLTDTLRRGNSERFQHLERHAPMRPLALFVPPVPTVSEPARRTVSENLTNTLQFALSDRFTFTNILRLGQSECFGQIERHDPIRPVGLYRTPRPTD